MKKILITGAAGFIGFHLCKKLIKENFKVIGFDNIERCTEARIPLTTIEVPRYEIGVKAYEILRTFMRDGHSKVPPRTLLDPKLIIRDSA